MGSYLGPAGLGIRSLCTGFQLQLHSGRRTAWGTRHAKGDVFLSACSAENVPMQTSAWGICKNCVIDHTGTFRFQIGAGTAGVGHRR